MARGKGFRLLDYLYNGGQTTAANAQLERTQQILAIIEARKEAGNPMTPDEVRDLTLNHRTTHPEQ